MGGFIRCETQRPVFLLRHLSERLSRKLSAVAHLASVSGTLIQQTDLWSKASSAGLETCAGLIPQTKRTNPPYLSHHMLPSASSLGEQ